MHLVMNNLLQEDFGKTSKRILWCLIALVLSPALFKFGEILVAVVVVVFFGEY